MVRSKTSSTTSVVLGFLVLFWCVNVPEVSHAQTTAFDQSSEDQQKQFFEKSVRPLLVARCLECHSKDTEINGGLSLDSRHGWAIGGDSGPAINTTDWEKSLLWLAVEYRNPKLQMPPDSKLSPHEREIVQSWLSKGAFDPREATENSMPKKSTALSVDKAYTHWAYRAASEVALPTSPLERGNSIDALLAIKQSEVGVEPNAIAAESILRQRLHIDLHGLRPGFEQPFSQFHQDSEFAYDQLVDSLLASPQFGERFARHWMDAVRFAESITLRGFVLPDAWRYRNYVIQAFNDDKPIFDFIREQVAGDLMQSETLREKQNRLIATSALALGDTNLEEQDKKQLEMDYIDEQLDMIGKVFLAQTIGCARCHDHKFDPIPTRDYYAMAGILKSSVSIEHSNVSKWISVPLPQDSATESRFEEASLRRSQLTKQLDVLKKKLQATNPSSLVVRTEDLEGIVIDDTQAKKVGDWEESTSVKAFVGQGYLHDKNDGKGQKSVTFEPADLKPGTYRLRMSYNHSPNRAMAAKVRIFSAEGEDLVRVNQTQKPADDGLWHTLGTYRFEEGGQAFLIVSNDDSSGHVIVDAVQFLPDAMKLGAAKASEAQPSEPSTSKRSEAETSKRLEAEASTSGIKKQIAAFESELKRLQSELDARPTVISLRPSDTPADIAVHVRGSVHQQGTIVPRGFLSCLPILSDGPIKPGANGRLELANWLVREENPLTARVYVNRVWYWLMGEGIVRTIDNFGTTGEEPIHPELLDWLTRQFVRHNWSTKWLVREIVRSEAYKRTSQAPKSSQAIDPDNRLFARASVRRLDAETFRDTLLAISGELELRADIGSTIHPKLKEDFAYKHDSHFRTVYGPWFRNSLPELYTQLDGANPSFPISKRNRSTIAPQALAMLNSEWISERTGKFGTMLAARSDLSEDQQIEYCFLCILNRLPSRLEMDWAKATIAIARQSQTQSDLLWGALAHELVASIDFRYIE